MENQKFQEERNQVSDELTYGYNKAVKILAIANDCIQARLAELQGNFPKAVDFLQQAIVEQDTLRYNEPADWFLSLRGMLGGLLVRMQKPSEAEQVFREELKKHPRNGRLLFGLRESLKAQSRFYDSYWVDEEFQKAWKYSAIQLNINEF